MNPQTIWERGRSPRTRILTAFAALGLIGGAFAVPAMAQTVTNQSPVAVADSLTTLEDTAGTVLVLANDSDPDGGTLTVTGIAGPSHGSAIINSGTSITYTPTANFNGSDSLTYTLSDGQGGVATGTVTITVTAVNDLPVAVADTATSTAGAVTIAVLANDTDAEGNTLSISAVTQGAHGNVVISGTSVIFTPVAGFSGTDTFTYTVSDGTGTATGTVTVTIVAAANVAPVAVDDSVNVRKDTPKTINVLANDTDANGGALQVSTTTAPAHGSLVVNADNTITYTPAAGFTGSDTFTYTVRDSGGLTDIGTVNVTVKARLFIDIDLVDDKNDCKKGGFIELGFRNQGLCVSAAIHAAHDDDDDDDDIEAELEDADDDDEDNRGHGSKNRGHGKSDRD